MNQRRLRRLCGVAAALLMFGGALAPVAGLNPAQQNAEFEVPLARFDLYGYSSPEVELAKQETEAGIARAYGGNWHVYAWNPQTRTPAYLGGSGAQVATAAELAARPEEIGRRVLARNAGALGVNPSQLRLLEVAHGLGKTAVHFQQTYEGLDVWGGRAHATFMDSGRLFVLSSNVYGNIELDVQPRLSAADAKELARLELPFDPATDTVEEGAELLVLPVPLSPNEVEHHLVWRVRVHTEDPLGIWVTHVDAHTGETLWRYNDVHFVDFTGDAESDVQPGTYCNGVETQVSAHLRLTVDGVGTTNTDADGLWTVPYGGNDPRTVSADLYGPYVDINNQGGAEAAFSGIATPGVPFTVDWDDTNAQHDERDVFDAVNDIHEFFLNFDPGFGYINQRIFANVSINATCNAFWNGTINFYREGGGCANTGEIQGVVQHEYGHGIQDYILGWQGSQGLGEGNADVLANIMTGESIVARGFYLNQCGSGIRNSENGLIYPDDLNGEVHHDGQIIAGFHWDAMEEFWTLYGQEQGTIMNAERWHFGRVLEHPTNQPDQVLATFIADDDDGNLDNGTPHHDILCIAATNHGYECPEILEGVIISHVPPPTPQPEGDVALTAEIYSTLAQMDPDSVLVYYMLNGSDFIALQMTPTGNPDEWQAVLENLTAPSEVEYYIHAVDLLGNFRNSPFNAPDGLHGFVIPTSVDDIEEDTGWSVNLEGTDDATTGIWERVDPVGTIAQPEDDHTEDPGVICWITGQHPGGGDGANDVDGGSTTLYSPVYDLTGASYAVVKYFRWYSNNKGNAPNADIWIVQARNDGGPWMDIENTQDDQNQWFLTGGDLLELFGGAIGEVQLKFIASDLGEGSLVEAGVDDFMLLVEQGGSDVASPGERLAYRLYAASPNPFTPRTTLRFDLPEAVPAKLAIYSVDGRVVRTLIHGSLPAGHHTVSWDTRDEAGRSVAAGLYYYVLEAGSFRATRPLVLVK